MISKSKKILETAINTDTKVTEELQVRKVEEGRSSMQAAKSQGKVISALMDQKHKGSIPGIHGRLKCVEYLKRNNVGCATFIGLDKMAKWKDVCQRKISTLSFYVIFVPCFRPENVPRLFDLVKTKDSSILPAFYFALRDTLVANDLDQATRIAYGKTRYRVVTLQGQLIDQSGM
ncbi:hypothetical protein KUTeg_011716 [Tegillarca granosa]|uniref:SMC hinge domain-containing protein n=1 Tax=Tegillarca granosa TaxID=220873 RepID=A0ABQ9F0X9_TEGGR|nr:hypothetical protein KUTeg_011716 [Tegillarca granosa]